MTSHPSRPEVVAATETLLTMLSELQRARAYAGRVAWRVPHPVRTRYCAKALRQIERQILAELEELYGVPVEIDPLLTDGGRQARAVENSSTRTTSGVPQNESPTSRTEQIVAIDVIRRGRDL